MPKQTEHPVRTCPCHREALVLRFTPAGASFWGCRLFEAEGCRYSWSDRDGRYFHPGLTSRPGGLRDRTMLRLVEEGLTVEEAKALMEGQDVREVASLVGLGAAAE